jgi:UrcA family protein
MTHSTATRRSLAATASAIALAVASTTAAEPVRTRIVTYADLDLASPAGAQELRVRLKRAAQSICADLTHGAPDLAAQSRFWACEADAFERALHSAPLNPAPPVSSTRATTRVVAVRATR